MILLAIVKKQRHFIPHNCNTTAVSTFLFLKKKKQQTILLSDIFCSLLFVRRFSIADCCSEKLYLWEDSGEVLSAFTQLINTVQLKVLGYSRHDCSTAILVQHQFV